MQITVKGKQLDVGQSLRNHVEETLAGVTGKYFSNPIEATVVFSRHAHLYRADVTVHVGRGIHMQSAADADDPYGAINQATERVGKRLRRYKRRLKDHHSRADEGAGEAIVAAQYILEKEPEPETDDHVEPEGEPTVVAEMQMPVETLTVGEAVMRMDLAELPALMFRNRAHGGLNMVYRRADGHVGWVDPRGNDQAAD